MQKLKATVKKLRVEIKWVGEKPLEIRATLLDNYTKEEPLLGVSDLTLAKRNFIERTAKWVLRSNKQYEEEARRGRQSFKYKLLVSKIDIV